MPDKRIRNRKAEGDFHAKQVREKGLEAQALEEVYSSILYRRDSKAEYLNDYENRIKEALIENPEANVDWWKEEAEKAKVQIQYLDKFADKVLAMF